MNLLVGEIVRTLSDLCLAFKVTKRSIQRSFENLHTTWYKFRTFAFKLTLKPTGSFTSTTEENGTNRCRPSLRSKCLEIVYITRRITLLL